MNHWETTPERSGLMKRVRQSGTRAEETVRLVAAEMGLRFETNPDDLPGRPDLVNRAEKWAVFVHGCFWHAHEGCSRWSIPKTNSSLWEEKFVRNRERDLRKRKSLEEEGYRVLVIWECETQNADDITRGLESLTRHM